MVVGREQESEAGGGQAAPRGLLIHRNPDTQGFEDVTTAALAGDGAVAMFDDRHAARRGQERGAGGDAQGAGRITAGTDDVDGAGSRRDPGPQRCLLYTSDAADDLLCVDL